MNPIVRTVLLVLGLMLLATSPAEAHGAGLPYHEAGQVLCQPGRVLAYPPRVMRPTQSVDWRNAQLVKWSPDLYRLRNNRWRLVDRSKPWDSAYTHDYGYLQPPYSTAWSKPNNLGALFEVFEGLPHGVYAVKNYVYWGATGVTHGHWGGTCAI